MVGELKISVIAAGGTAFVAEDHLHQVPMHRAVIRAESLYQFLDRSAPGIHGGQPLVKRRYLISLTKYAACRAHEKADRKS
ncbi:hypothetical protein EN820_54405, partial [bacterium M00.F.Ca.ET.177.01.1.1]